ncbi:hypothetical protein H6G00_23175 [Leptolyngbya sp. FACHB-541]|uniref:hypothetical protein n=1 Tax=Leptolyngbya sp. FACHB-541 TaxID=2692810 RepID=UPI001685C745|nr:hypothetical protein [Leptolyngbya sp. FACHB-541]MBD1999478.1 hypothetical protein [Leptolyngbya sp. FACHB-541]
MMSDSKQQFSNSFLNNELDNNFAKSNSAKENPVKLKPQKPSSSLLDGVAVFPDGSVTWVPDSDAIGNDGIASCEMTLPYLNHRTGQSYFQNRNYHPSAAVALIKRIIKQQILSFQRVPR